MKTGKNIFPAVLAFLIIVSMNLAGCTPTPTIAPSPTHIPTATSVPLLVFSLEPGQNYFSQNGQPGLFYSRNVVALHLADFDTLLDWSASGGTRVIRFGLGNFPVFGGYTYTNTGELNEEVVGNIEHLLDDAEAHGIYAFVWFTGWLEWNTNGQNDWANNPFNVANGGPAQNPTDVFQEGTPANTMWFEYVNRLVTRWQDRDNILAWEALGEANLIQGINEPQGIAFVEHMAQVIHAADSKNRPLSASLGAEDGNTWRNFYDSDAIDFIQVHPYPTTLDRYIIDKVRQYLNLYHKPVIIGESGLNWEKPDQLVTSSPDAHIGIEHAIWAGVVSGAMNARALFWEDSYACYFPTMGWPFLTKYAEVELPVARFTSGVDFTDFTPLAVQLAGGTKIWGASVGNDHLVLGWFRDAASEPPDWNLQLIPAGKKVTITVLGTAANWRVDFYDTSTGTTILSSTSVTRHGNTVIVTLPEFQDDIAFKMIAQAATATVTP